MPTPEYQQKLSSILERVPDTDVPDHLIGELDQLLERWPTSWELWLQRSRLIQLGESTDTYGLGEAKASLIKAAELAPAEHEPHEELAFYIYAIEDNAALAIPHFRRALELAAGRKCAGALEDALKEVAG